MNEFAVYLVPICVALIVLFGFFKRVPVFDAFLSGAKEGFSSTIAIAPALVGLITSVSMLKASGALDIFSSFIAPVANFLGVPGEVMPLALLRPVSGSGSLAFIDHIFADCGPDSFAGRVAAVMMGSTETTFYAITVYFGAVGVKKTRHTIPAALTADTASFVFAAIAVRLLFMGGL